MRVSAVKPERAAAEVGWALPLIDRDPERTRASGEPADDIAIDTAF